MGESGIPPLTRPEDILRQVELRPLIAMAFFFFLSSIRGYAIDCGSHGAEVFYRFWTLSFDARLWSADNFMFKGLFGIS